MSQWMWRDSKGVDAPELVRRAIDNLMTAVNEEEKLALEAGVSVKRFNHSLGAYIARGILCIISYGCSECYYWFTRPNPQEIKDYSADKAFECDSIVLHRMVYDKKKGEVNQAKNKLRFAVNASVITPVHYSGDISEIDIGPYVESGKWSMKGGDSCLSVNIFKYNSVKRDTKDIKDSLMQFANSHGGWRGTTPNPPASLV